MYELKIGFCRSPLIYNMWTTFRPFIADERKWKKATFSHAFVHNAAVTMTSVILFIYLFDLFLVARGKGGGWVIFAVFMSDCHTLSVLALLGRGDGWSSCVTQTSGASLHRFSLFIKIWFNRPQIKGQIQSWKKCYWLIGGANVAWVFNVPGIVSMWRVCSRSDLSFSLNSFSPPGHKTHH